MENHKNLMIGAAIIVLAVGGFYLSRSYMGKKEADVKIQSTKTQTTLKDKMMSKKSGGSTPMPS